MKDEGGSEAEDEKSAVAPGFPHGNAGVANACGCAKPLLQEREQTLQQGEHRGRLAPPAARVYSACGSDRDRVVGVTCDVPAGARAALGEKGVAAGDVLFGMDLVEFEGGLVTFVGDGQETNAVNRTGSGTECWEMKADFEPGEVHEIEKKDCADCKTEQTKPRGTRSDGDSG
jgi:hypothetical protein